MNTILRRAAAVAATAIALLALTPAANATTTGIPYSTGEAGVRCRAPYTDARGVTDTPCIGMNVQYHVQGEADVYTNGRAVTGCKAQLIHVADGAVYGTVYSYYVSGGNCTAQGQWPGVPSNNDEYVIRGFYQLGGTWYGQPESPAFYWAS